jgi:hypothetical protein
MAVVLSLGDFFGMLGMRLILSIIATEGPQKLGHGPHAHEIPITPVPPLKTQRSTRKPVKVYRWTPDRNDPPKMETFYINMNECGPMVTPNI